MVKILNAKKENNNSNKNLNVSWAEEVVFLNDIYYYFLM